MRALVDIHQAHASTTTGRHGTDKNPDDATTDGAATTSTDTTGSSPKDEASRKGKHQRTTKPRASGYVHASRE